ncbi:putative aquaporin [Coleophoma cylindrospora]|uniref:Putative aquaporin n=1 Tax=Coleophoma cylindrospora TaxID=1849047 RepID=A0A3D8S868_9HELO|nr:putative aquaporin [Coleophoma cylindrospora]
MGQQDIEQSLSIRSKRRQSSATGFLSLKNPSPLTRSITFKHLILAMLGEFCGTVMFLFFAFGGVMVGKSALGGNPSTSSEYLVFLLYGASSFGMSLAINAWIFYRVTGGLFNPAVTFAFVLAGLMHPLKGALLSVTQILGGIAAAAIIDGLTPGPLLVSNSLGPNVSVTQGLFMEMFLTAELILAILMLAVEKHKATFVAPIGIGIALFIGHLVGIFFTGAGLNPARSLGPAAVSMDFPSYHWIYWAGPALGAILATGFYKLLLALEYAKANPHQDRDSPMMVDDAKLGSSMSDSPIDLEHV